MKCINDSKENDKFELGVKGLNIQLPEVNDL